MTGERQELDIPDLGNLDDFDIPSKPVAKTERPKAPAKQQQKKAIDKASSFPSRQANDEDQINIKGPTQILERFRTLSKTERYPYFSMLEILMNSYEEQNKK